MAKLATFKMTVSGTYYTTNKNEMVRNFDSVTAILDEDTVECFAKHLKHDILPVKLRRKHGDFKRVRSFIVEDVIPSAEDVTLEFLPEETQVRLMSLKQLKAFIKRKKIPLDAGIFSNTKEVRDLVIQALMAPTTFERKAAQKGALSRTLSRFAALDPELAGDQDADLNPQPPNPSKEGAEISGTTEDKAQLVKEAKALGINATIKWNIETIKKRIGEATPTELLTEDTDTDTDIDEADLLKDI